MFSVKHTDGVRGVRKKRLRYKTEILWNKSRTQGSEMQAVVKYHRELGKKIHII